MMQPVPGVSAFPNGDNIFSWAATIEGSAGTVRSRQTLLHDGRVSKR